MIARCPAHIILLAEASGVNNEELAPLLQASDRPWCWTTSLCANLAVGVRENVGLSMGVLYDSTDIRTPLHRDYNDDPCESKPNEKILFYVIVEIHVGSLAQGAVDASRRASRPVIAGMPISRAHVESVRVCVYHLDNTAARANAYAAECG